MNSLKAMYGCGLNFFIKLAYNSLFLYKFANVIPLKNNNLKNYSYGRKTSVRAFFEGRIRHRR